MKIVNKSRFIKANSILITVILGIILFSKGSYSKGEIEYKETYIYSGDTLWNIAKEESITNKYFQNRDIRDIILELKKINKLYESYLSEGDKIIIPKYK